MTDWQRKQKVRIAIRADVYGCLAVHPGINASGYTISHVGSGFGFPIFLREYADDARYIRAFAEAIANTVPDLDARLHRLADGKLSEAEITTLSGEIRSAIDAVPTPPDAGEG